MWIFHTDVVELTMELQKRYILSQSFILLSWTLHINVLDMGN